MSAPTIGTSGPGVGGSGLPLHASGRSRVRRFDAGIVPLIVCCPFMYFPKILEGDTQPWVMIAALIALFTFRTRRFILRGDVALVLIAMLCVVVYAVRAGFGLDLLRATYNQLAFIVLWLVCRRDQGDYLPTAIRLTVIVWLAVGLYQYVFVALGLPIEISGRFVEGRSGVPSLTSSLLPMAACRCCT